MPIHSDPSTWQDPRQVLGFTGETVAKRFLRARGWRILEHRFRMGRLEVDLIARRAGVVAFVEVKTRRSRGFGSPLEAVTWGKRREIHRVAQAWVDRQGKPGDTYRFDVIGVAFSGGVVRELTHVEDAFRLVR